MTQETCARCGAPQPEATAFCTNCGNPTASAGDNPTPASGQPGAVPSGHPTPGAAPQPAWGPPGGPGDPGGPTPPAPPPAQGGGAGKRIALIIAIVLLLLIGGGIAAAVVLGDDDDDSEGGKGSGSVEEFCQVFHDFEELDTGDGGSLEEMRVIAERMREVGAPEDIPDDAEEGIDALVSTVEGADSEEDMEANLMSLSEEEHRNISAAFDYAETTCAEAEDGESPGSLSPDTFGDGGSDGGGDTGSDGGSDTGTTGPGLGEDDPSTTTRTVTEAEFCTQMRRLEEIDGESPDEFAKGKILLQEIASRGTPEEMPAEARDGFDEYMRRINEATSFDDLDAFGSELTPDAQQQLQAFFEYVETTCMNSDDSE